MVAPDQDGRTSGAAAAGPRPVGAAARHRRVRAAALTVCLSPLIEDVARVQPSSSDFGCTDSIRSSTRQAAPIAPTSTPSPVVVTAVGWIFSTNGELST